MEYKVNIEPKWIDIFEWVKDGSVKMEHSGLENACKIADIVRQAQKDNKRVIVEPSGKCYTEDICDNVILTKEQQELLCVIFDDAFSITNDNLKDDDLYYLKLVQYNLKNLKNQLGLKREDED